MAVFKAIREGNLANVEVLLCHAAAQTAPTPVHLVEVEAADCYEEVCVCDIDNTHDVWKGREATLWIVFNVRQFTDLLFHREMFVPLLSS